MADYQIETKKAFTILGLGTTLSGNFSEMAQQKSDWWQKITSGLELETLEVEAVNNNLYAVNEAQDNEYHYYVGREVASDAKTMETNQTIINFPAGDYVVIKAVAATPVELFSLLEEKAFGEILPEISDYTYVGGPNATVLTGVEDLKAFGEIWIPVTAK